MCEHFNETLDMFIRATQEAQPDTADLREQMKAAGAEKPRARCFPDGLGRINIKTLADRQKIIRILIDRLQKLGRAYHRGRPNRLERERRA